MCATPEVAARVLAMTQDPPTAVEIGLIHRDFCGDNLVRTQQGSIVCIDNASLICGPLDFDLARTWYRWELTPYQTLDFLRGYKHLRSPRGFLEHAGYWCVLALVGSIQRRLREGTGNMERPLEMLSSLLARFDAGRRGVSLLG